MSQDQGSKFEERGREIASRVYKCDFAPEKVNGIAIDAVGKPNRDYYHLIEFTIEKNLDKVRKDILKLQLAKQKLLADNIYSQCKIILKEKPTQSMKETADDYNIEIMTLDEFFKSWFDYMRYWTNRSESSFGSAFEAKSGRPDRRPYIPVLFEDFEHKNHSIEDIMSRIRNQSFVLLKGEFGTGKSRTLQEIFFRMKPNSLSEFFPIAIDLRQMWGMRNADEVLRRHLASLSLLDLTEGIVSASSNGQIIWLIDGFDELAIQAWSDDPKTVAQSRFQSLEAVRDILNLGQNGAIVAGRDHYFNDDSEMIGALGVPQDSTIIRTKDEFSEEEALKFVSNISEYDFLPLWLPKKPLTCELYISMSTKDNYDQEFDSIVGFWEYFLDAICRRDAEIRKSYLPNTIADILTRLSRHTRMTEDGRGPITLSDIQEAFEEIVGQIPAQEASAMLQRLPGMGRVQAGGEERQFVDNFIVEGLRGRDVVAILSSQSREADLQHWKHPVALLGEQILASSIDKNSLGSAILSEISRAHEVTNQVYFCDLLSGILASNVNIIDFGGAFIEKGKIASLNFSSKSISNIKLSEIEKKNT